MPTNFEITGEFIADQNKTKSDWLAEDFEYLGTKFEIQEKPQSDEQAASDAEGQPAEVGGGSEDEDETSDEQ